MIAQSNSRRRWRIVVWLLTPLVAWAASFFGGWIGAVMARDAGQGASGLFRLGQGAIVGGGIGFALCLIVLRSLRDRDGPPADGS